MTSLILTVHPDLWLWSSSLLEAFETASQLSTKSTSLQPSLLVSNFTSWHLQRFGSTHSCSTLYSSLFLPNLYIWSVNMGVDVGRLAYHLLMDIPSFFSSWTSGLFIRTLYGFCLETLYHCGLMSFRSPTQLHNSHFLSLLLGDFPTQTNSTMSMIIQHHLRSSDLNYLQSLPTHKMNPANETLPLHTSDHLFE